jgi:hypothetical protein
MARQYTTFQSLKSILGAAVVGLGLVILFGQLDGPAAQATNLLGTTARETLDLLPSIVSAAWQALQVYMFDHQGLASCPLQMFVSFWPLLHIIAGAA